MINRFVCFACISSDALWHPSIYPSIGDDDDDQHREHELVREPPRYAMPIITSFVAVRRKRDHWVNEVFRIALGLLVDKVSLTFYWPWVVGGWLAGPEHLKPLTNRTRKIIKGN